MLAQVTGSDYQGEMGLQCHDGGGKKSMPGYWKSLRASLSTTMSYD